MPFSAVIHFGERLFKTTQTHIYVVVCSFKMIPVKILQFVRFPRCRGLVSTRGLYQSPKWWTCEHSGAN